MPAAKHVSNPSHSSQQRLPAIARPGETKVADILKLRVANSSFNVILPVFEGGDLQSNSEALNKRARVPAAQISQLSSASDRQSSL
jgi:hypothetical protein